jgi:hypothetical protein
MTSRRSALLRVVHTAHLAAVGAVAAVAMMVTAPVGLAIPESTIASECIAAGGTYTTTGGSDGKRHSKCCYRDINDVKQCDNYVDGTFTNTTDSLEKPPTSPPPQPSGAVVGPTASVATQPPTASPALPDMTLYMPPPAGPAAPPPSEAVLAP